VDDRLPRSVYAINACASPVTTTTTSTLTKTVTATQAQTTITQTTTETQASVTVTQTSTSLVGTVTTTATVTGTQSNAIIVYVYSSNGTPVNNELVTLTNSSTSFSKTGNTNSSGIVVFNNLAPGSTYKVSASVDNAKLSAPVSINGNTAIVVLEPSPSSSNLMSGYEIGGVIAAVVIVAGLSGFFLRRRHVI
jgi:hypothetical protein